MIKIILWKQMSFILQTLKENNTSLVIPSSEITFDIQKKTPKHSYVKQKHTNKREQGEFIFWASSYP